jgi:hypothetical protein
MCYVYEDFIKMIDDVFVSVKNHIFTSKDIIKMFQLDKKNNIIYVRFIDDKLEKSYVINKVKEYWELQKFNEYLANQKYVNLCDD